MTSIGFVQAEETGVEMNGVEYSNSEIECATNRINGFIETHNRYPNFVRMENENVMKADYMSAIGNNIIKPNVQPTHNINGNTYTEAQIEDASNRVNNFIRTHNRLPNFVTISGRRVMIHDFLPLMEEEVPVNNELTEINGYGYTAAQINDASNRVNNFIRTHNRLPNFVTISGRTVMINDFLPVMGDDVEEIIRGTGVTSLGNGQLNGLYGMSGLDIVASYISRNLNHGLGLGTTAANVERTGTGDCWGLSAWAAQVFYENGYGVRIEQGATSASWNHRWIRIQVDGTTVRFDPSAVTRRYGYRHYSTVWGSTRNIVASFGWS